MTKFAEQQTPGGKSAESLVDAAVALRGPLLEAQRQTEKEGRYPADLHEAFARAGFYRMLTPAAFGGLELGIETFFRVIIEVARGNPSAGWCLSLGAGHALPMASYFDEAAQREAFGSSPDFICPHRNQGGFGRAVRQGEGLVVDATYNYCSGVPYSTHFMGTTLLSDEDGAKRQVVVVLPRGEYDIVDDWGDGSILGMQGSGSNSVRVNHVFVPLHMTSPYDWVDHVGPTLGTELHGNPLYIGRLTAFYAGEVVSVAVGTARAALDEFERIITTKKTLKPPHMLRYEHHDFQRAFGLALTMTDAAESILRHVGILHAQYAEAALNGGPAFTAREDTRLRGRVHQAGRLATEAVELLFQNAGSSAAMAGQLMQRYYRDISVFKTHPTGNVLNLAGIHAQTYFDRLKEQQDLV